MSLFVASEMKSASKTRQKIVNFSSQREKSEKGRIIVLSAVEHAHTNYASCTPNQLIAQYEKRGEKDKQLILRSLFIYSYSSWNDNR